MTTGSDNRWVLAIAHGLLFSRLSFEAWEARDDEQTVAYLTQVQLGWTGGIG